MHVVVDLRPLQDPRFAAKGIGQHGISVIAALAAMPGVVLSGIVDPLMDRLDDPAAALVGSLQADPTRFDGEVYVNLSPLTHDTATMVTALRAGMRRLAVVHDFIPMRDGTAERDPAGFQHYEYLVRSLGRYDALLANSDATLSDITALMPDYAGRAVTLHCRSRFAGAQGGAQQPTPLSPRLTRLLVPGGFVFVGAADDPRKNPEVAIRAALTLKAAGLTVVIGGGFAEASRNRLRAEFPRAFLLAEPLFLPRLSDEELLAVYQAAAVVVVPSRDEGFSLPVAEAVALNRPVAASNIPAHAEQIADPGLLFDPLSPDDLVRAVLHARGLRGAALGARYRPIPHDAEVALLHDLVRAPVPPRDATVARELTIVGPDFAKPTGVAVYNKMMAAVLVDIAIAFSYVDVDDMDGAAFHRWLYDNQDATLIYVVGNNDRFHARCFDAMQNVPGLCVLHDSRMFEFLLNRYGPHYLVALWRRRRVGAAIDVRTVETWQAHRRLLKDSFLDPVIARATGIVVHNRLQVDHIVETYGSAKARYIPFASQMTVRERDYVLRKRRRRAPVAGERLTLAMFGETEANKGCVEIVYALAMLRIARVAARVHFVGKSEGNYHAELLNAARAVGVAEHVEFHQYVTRENYLDWLATADIAVQLRHPLFGQVSGPVSDAAMCGVPLVTTHSLATGMDIVGHCQVVPDLFSPLHVSEAVRAILAAGLTAAEPMRTDRGFGLYLEQLLALAAPEGGLARVAPVRVVPRAMASGRI